MACETASGCLSLFADLFLFVWFLETTVPLLLRRLLAISASKSLQEKWVMSNVSDLSRFVHVGSCWLFDSFLFFAC